jgi:hypothetical protein
MRRAASLTLAIIVLVPASAGASTNRPPVGLTATPARVSLAGSSTADVRVSNPGSISVVVDVEQAGFSLDLRGQPKVVPRGGNRAAAGWLTVRPARFELGAGETRPLAVSARLPEHIEPGDHDALVLLTTRLRRGGGVAVRMRLGIVVVVRAPGRVVRRLALGRLDVRRTRTARILELRIANRGNVTETLARGRVRLLLRRGGAVTRLGAAPRDLRPQTSGIVQLRYGGRLRGWVTARAEVATEPGMPVLRRTFRIRL